MFTVNALTGGGDSGGSSFPWYVIVIVLIILVLVVALLLVYRKRRVGRFDVRNTSSKGLGIFSGRRASSVSNAWLNEAQNSTVSITWGLMEQCIVWCVCVRVRACVRACVCACACVCTWAGILSSHWS